MSLINDALKRATVEQPRATLPPGEVPHMQPVHTAPKAAPSPLVAGGIILIGIGATGIAAALWFKGQTPTPVHAAAPVQTQPTPQPQTIAAVQPPVSTAPAQPKQSPTTAPTKVASATTANAKITPPT